MIPDRYDGVELGVRTESMTVSTAKHSETLEPRHPKQWGHLACVLWTLGCAAMEVEDPQSGAACSESGDESAAVIWSLGFGRIDDAGISPGFDLDRVTTQAGESTGCGVADWRGPNGQTGIDNALGSIIPLLEVTEASAAESLLEDGIRSGDLLLFLDMKGIDDPEYDDCVDLTLLTGTGDPLLSTQNEILAGQTFARLEDEPGDTLTGLEMNCGSVEGHPISLTLPFSILGVELEVELSHGMIQTTLEPDGSMVGTIGAGLETAFLMEVANHPNVNDEVAVLLEQLLSIHADLDFDGDGVCEQISASLIFEAAEAYLFESRR